MRAILIEEKDKDAVCREMGVDRNYLRVLLHRARVKFKDELANLPPVWDKNRNRERGDVLLAEGLLRRRTFELMDGRVSLEEIAHKTGGRVSQAIFELAGGTVVRRFDLARIQPLSTFSLAAKCRRSIPSRCPSPESLLTRRYFRARRRGWHKAWSTGLRR